MSAFGQAVLAHDAWRGVRNPKTQEVLRTGDMRAGRLARIMTRRHFVHVMPMAMMVELPPGTDLPSDVLLFGFSPSMSGAHDFSFRFETRTIREVGLRPQDGPSRMLDICARRLEDPESGSVLAVVLRGSAPASRQGWRMMRGCGFAMESDRRALYPEVFYEFVLDPTGGRLCFVPAVDRRRYAAFIPDEETTRDQVQEVTRMVNAPAWGYGEKPQPLIGPAR